MDKTVRSCWHHHARFFIELWNSISLMVFLFATQVSTSLPVRYRRFGGCAFFAITIEFAKLVLMKPGSIKTTFIPKDSNSYAIDSDKPSTANLVLT